MVTAPLARRGFLRNMALAVGAVLVGVGRSAVDARGTTTTQYCSSCGSTCPEDERGNTVCPGDTVPLDWQSPLGGRCVECYKSEAAREKAEREMARINRREGRNRRPCFYCGGVECGYYDGPGSNGNGSSGQFSYEDPLGVFDSIGAGCHDPATGETSPWSEPGDACSDLDAQETAPENT